MENNDIEKDVIASLLNSGMKLPPIKKRWIYRLFSKKKYWEFTVKQPTLGTLDRISEVSLDLYLNEENINLNPINESLVTVNQNAKKAAKIIAISIAGTKDVINIIYINKLTSIIYEGIKPSELFQISMIINAVNNMSDFVNSIRLMKGVRNSAPRNPKADLVEEKKQD